MRFHEFMQDRARPVDLAAGQHVFTQGDENKNLYFIRDGILKAYYTTEDGREAVKSLLFPGDIIGSLAAIENGSCSFTLVCLERASLSAVPFAALLATTRDDHELAIDMIEALLRFARKKEKREFDFLCRSAEERYRELLRQAPDIFEKVTQNDIARYLGVTPVALSRIKKRVFADTA